MTIQGKPSKIAVVDATGIALKTIGNPITNMAMLGAFSVGTGWVGIKAVREAITNRFSKDAAEKNIKAADLAFEETTVLELKVL
jgi:pyruvate ferredoxin oxidoreductase gamma subunit